MGSSAHDGNSDSLKRLDHLCLFSWSSILPLHSFRRPCHLEGCLITVVCFIHSVILFKHSHSHDALPKLDHCFGSPHGRWCCGCSLPREHAPANISHNHLYDTNGLPHSDCYCAQALGSSSSSLHCPLSFFAQYDVVQTNFLQHDFYPVQL